MWLIYCYALAALCNSVPAIEVTHLCTNCQLQALQRQVNNKKNIFRLKKINKHRDTAVIIIKNEKQSFTKQREFWWDDCRKSVRIRDWSFSWPLKFKILYFCLYRVAKKCWYPLFPQPHLVFFLISHWVHTAPQQLRQIIACWAVRALTNPLQMPAWCWSKKLQ